MDLGKVRAKKSEYTDYITDTMNDVITKCGKRFPGTEGEEKAANFLKDELSSYCDEVKVESFEIHPESFYGWVPWTITLALFSIASTFFIPLLSVILLIFAIIPMIVIFISYNDGFDKLFKKKTSHNVEAVINPKGEIKQVVYFNGHIDAAREWSMLHIGGGVFFSIVTLSAILSLFYILGVSIYRIVDMKRIGVEIASGIPLYVSYSMLAFVPALILTYFTSNKKVVTDGANDDLSGAIMAIGVVKALKDNGIKFEHTKVGVLLTGSEEIGLRGAKAWSRAHKAEYKDISCDIYAFDTLNESKYMTVNRKDINATVKTNERMGKYYMDAAKKLGIKCKYDTVPFGATDGAAFCQNGLNATSVVAMNHLLPRYYHTRIDTMENINKDCIGDAWEICVELLKNYE